MALVLEGLIHADSIPFLRFDFANRLPGVEAGVSLRQGGGSLDPYASNNMSYSVGDDPAVVTANRAGLVTSLGLDPARLTMGRQVHDGHVHVVTADDIGRGGLDPETAIPDTDGLVSNHPEAVLAVLQADCVPVACWDPARKVMGVAHSGWPGTVAQVTTNLINTMAAEFGTDPADVWAVIGPSIGPDSYEVKEDVASKARDAFATLPGGEAVIVYRPDDTMAFDLWHANRIQLLAAGVQADRIQVTGLDSYELNDRFYSHRRLAPSGRFLCLMARR